MFRRHCTGFFPVQCCLASLGQHCTKFLPVQCCPKSIKTTLNRIFSCALLSSASWTTFHKEYCLVNVVQIGLRQHCTQKNTCPKNVGTECTDLFLQGNDLYNVVFICLCQRFTRKLFTCATLIRGP